MKGCDIHPGNPLSRIHADGGLVLTGGPTGSLAMHSSSSFFKARGQNIGAPLWFLPQVHGNNTNCTLINGMQSNSESSGGSVHIKAVTGVVLRKSLNIGFSCGRDGTVRMIRNAALADGPVPIVTKLCTVTGEMNCLCLSQDGARLFFGGNSVRCIDIATRKVSTVNLNVPFPISSLAVSPCLVPPDVSNSVGGVKLMGEYIAMASASKRDVGVVRVNPDVYNTSPISAPNLQIQDSAPTNEGSNINSSIRLFAEVLPMNFTLQNILPEASKRQEMNPLRMCWTVRPSSAPSVEPSSSLSGNIPNKAATPSTSACTLLSSQLRLYIPCDDGIRVFEVQSEPIDRIFGGLLSGSSNGGGSHLSNSMSSSKPSTAAKMVSIGTIETSDTNSHSAGRIGHQGISFCSVYVQYVSKNKLEVITYSMGGSRVLALKVDLGTGGRNGKFIKTCSVIGAADVERLELVGDDTNTDAAAKNNSSSGDAVVVVDFSFDAHTGFLGIMDSRGRLGITQAFALATLKRKPTTKSVSVDQELQNQQPSQSQHSTQHTLLTIGSQTQFPSQTQNDSSNSTAAAKDDKESEDDKEVSSSSASSTSSDSDDSDDAVQIENVAKTATDLIKNNPNYIPDHIEAKKMERHRRERIQDALKNKEKEAKLNKASIRDQLGKQPSFVEHEAEDSDRCDEDNTTDSNNEEDGHFDSDVDETASEELRRVENEFANRYQLKKRGSSNRNGGRIDKYDDDDNSINSNQGEYVDVDGIDDTNEDQDLRGFGQDTSRGNASREKNSNSTVVVKAHLYRFQPGATRFPGCYNNDCQDPEQELQDLHLQQIQEEIRKRGEGSAPPLPLPSKARYLSFNSIGAIRQIPGHIFVNFHDISRTSIRLAETRYCVAGALSTTGFALAFVSTEMAGTDKTPVTMTTIWHRSYVSLAVESDWSVQLAKNEILLNLAVGTSYVAAITSCYTRIFSVSGLEMAVFSLPGHIVCAFGLNTMSPMALPYAKADPFTIAFLDAAMNLKVQVFDAALDGKEILPPTDIAISPDQLIGRDAGMTSSSNRIGQVTLRWMGWSDSGVLHTVDSIGVVRKLSKSWGERTWIPVYDPRHLGNSRERNWIWGITSEDVLLSYRTTVIDNYSEEAVDFDDNRFDLAAGPSSMMPLATTALPPVSRLRTCLPLLRSNGDQAMITRDAFLRSYQKSIAVKKTATHYSEEVAALDIEIDELLLSQFKSAIKAGSKTSRALDIASYFQLTQTLKEAGKFANSHQNSTGSAVVTKILALIELRARASGVRKHRVCTLPAKPEISNKEKDRLLKQFLTQEKKELMGVIGADISTKGNVVSMKEAPAMITTPQRQVASKCDKTSGGVGERTPHLLSHFENGAGVRPAEHTQANVTSIRNSKHIEFREEVETVQNITLPEVKPKANDVAKNITLIEDEVRSNQNFSAVPSSDSPAVLKSKALATVVEQSSKQAPKKTINPFAKSKVLVAPNGQSPNNIHSSSSSIVPVQRTLLTSPSPSTINPNNVKNKTSEQTNVSNKEKEEEVIVSSPPMPKKTPRTESSLLEGHSSTLLSKTQNSNIGNQSTNNNSDNSNQIPEETLGLPADSGGQVPQFKNIVMADHSSVVTILNSNIDQSEVPKTIKNIVLSGVSTGLSDGGYDSLKIDEKTTSFADALRKRYREESDDEE